MHESWQWFQDNVWAMWLGAAVLLGLAGLRRLQLVLLGLAELVSLNLVLLMLAGGAVVGMLVSLTPAGVGVQVLAAVAASISMLMLVRPNIIRRLHTGPDLRTGPAALIGKEGF